MSAGNNILRNHTVEICYTESKIIIIYDLYFVPQIKSKPVIHIVSTEQEKREEERAKSHRDPDVFGP